MAYKYKALDLPYSEQSTLSDYIENFNTLRRSIDYTALNEYIEDSIKIMKEGVSSSGILNQLPVVENGKLIGIISDGDIIQEIF